MEIETYKWIALVAILGSTLIFSVLPLILTKCFRCQPNSRHLLISLFSCFAGGVFMATGLLDIFPEVHDDFEKASWGHGYPAAEFFVAIGFFLVLTLEQIVLHFKEATLLPSEQSENEDLIPRDELHNSQRFQGSLQGVSNHPMLSSTSSALSADDTPEVPHSSLRTLLLVGALSLHSVFEGVAIGLQTDVDKLLQILVAVLLHKSVITFSLGLNLVQSELKLWSIIQSNLAFCFATPLGILSTFGIEDIHGSVDQPLVIGILQGIACGTFFYVTFFEVLPHELNAGGDRLLKLLAIILGFSVISGVLFLDPDNQKAPNVNAALVSNSASNFHLL